jgi:hypothetical protein
VQVAVCVGASWLEIYSRGSSSSSAAGKVQTWEAMFTSCRADLRATVMLQQALRKTGALHMSSSLSMLLMPAHDEAVVRCRSTPSHYGSS